MLSLFAMIITLAYTAKRQWPTPVQVLVVSCFIIIMLGLVFFVWNGLCSYPIAFVDVSVALVILIHLLKRLKRTAI